MIVPVHLKIGEKMATNMEKVVNCFHFMSFLEEEKKIASFFSKSISQKEENFL
jgi:hypothetical protein